MPSLRSSSAGRIDIYVLEQGEMSAGGALQAGHPAEA
jgi:hypothetical protein